MNFALRLDRQSPIAPASWLLLATALVSVQALRPAVEALERAISSARPTPASVPAPAVDPRAAAPFVLHSTKGAAEHEQAVSCLAAAVYFEAGTESLEGQRAVAQVVLNRVRDPKFPASVCGVVFQGAPRRKGCQFSFVCDGSLHRRPPGPAQLARARSVAEQALGGRVEPEVGTATHYHASYVHPVWERRLVRVDRIGAHIFYRRPGKAGEPSALTHRYAGGELQVAGLHRLLARS